MKKIITLELDVLLDADKKIFESVKKRIIKEIKHNISCIGNATGCADYRIEIKNIRNKKTK